MREGLWEDSLQRFRERVGAATPTPGGGAVAAVTATFAAALLRMVCEISLARAQDTQYSTIEAILAEVKLHEDRLAQCAEEDIRVFDTYMSAKQSRQAAESQQLLAACASVPLEAAEQVEKLQSLLKTIEGISPAFLTSDLQTASHLLRASVDSLLANVKINLTALGDCVEKWALQKRYDRLAQSPSRDTK